MLPTNSNWFKYIRDLTFFGENKLCLYPLMFQGYAYCVIKYIPCPDSDPVFTDLYMGEKN